VGVPTSTPLADKGAYVVKRAGKCTVRPERVVRRGRVCVMTGVDVVSLGWVCGLPLSYRVTPVCKRA